MLLNSPEVQYNDGTNKIFLSAKNPLSKRLTDEMKKNSMAISQIAQMMEMSEAEIEALLSEE